MFNEKLRKLIDRFLTQFFKNITSKSIGSLLFYHIVLRGGYGINKFYSLSGHNLKDLAISTTNSLALRELKRLIHKAKNMEEIVDIGLSFYFILSDIPSSLIHKIHIVSFQNRFELIEYLKLIKSIKPKIILDIGTAMGGTLFLLSRFSAPDALLISVDLPEIFVGGRKFPNNPSFFKIFTKKKQKVILIRDDSHKFSTFNSIKKVLNNRKIDILFIDGDHSYEGLKQDFEMYKPLVKSGGLVCFHDIVSGSYKKVGDVPKFWNNIRNEFNYREIVENWNQEGFGIGILFIK
ncbi:MAG: class I SAM-dependent methyltransferase [Promethearchaeota archaeon]